MTAANCYEAIGMAACFGAGITIGRGGELNTVLLFLVLAAIFGLWAEVLRGEAP